MMTPHRLAGLYALFATLALPLVAFTMPPFQNADEPAHVYRADQISHGQFLGHRVAVNNSGGDVDAGVPVTERNFDALPFHREHKVTRDMYVAKAWGPVVPNGFPNTALYPPVFYLPAAAALAAARAMNLPILIGLHAARLATGTAAISITSLAILLAGDGAIWIFAIMLLPMSLALTAAVSQDAPMLAATALAAALCRQAWLSSPTRARILAIAVLFTCVAMARPPYAAFALLLLGMRASWGARIAGFATVLAGTLIWSRICLPLVVFQTYPEGVVDPAAQWHRLLEAPSLLLPLAQQTWHVFGRICVLGFIGYPGWLDVDLPLLYHKIALGILALAACVALRRGLLKRHYYPFLVPAAILGATCGIALIQYLTWNIVGATMIDGMQGRYFLAPALLLAILPATAQVTQGSRSWRVAQAMVALFPIISITILIHALLLRYYV